MKTENQLKEILTRNLISYRKQNNLTQLQLAEKLNYSDKAISKWERGESIPDLYILYTLAEMYHITLNDFFAEDPVVIEQPKKRFNPYVIILFSITVVWLLGTIGFFVLSLLNSSVSYFAFLFALPTSFVVSFILSLIYKLKFSSFIAYTGFNIFIPLSVCIAINSFININNLWLLMLVCIPVELLGIFFFFIKKQKKDS